MNNDTPTVLIENEMNIIGLNKKDAVVMLTWKDFTGVTEGDFSHSVKVFADKCFEYNAQIAYIDASKLDANSAAFAWLRTDDYNNWWMNHIVPIYNKAQVEKLVVVTGHPESPGVLPSTPDGVDFGIGYFEGAESAQAWIFS